MRFGESGESDLSKQIGLKASTDGSVLTFTKRNNFSPEVVSAKIADQTQEFLLQIQQAMFTFLLEMVGKLLDPRVNRANEFITLVMVFMMKLVSG